MARGEEHCDELSRIPADAQLGVRLPARDLNLARFLELAQPSVSKHLRVLRDVGLVRSRREGKQVMYRTNATGLIPLHEWAGTFERLWRAQLSQIKERAERE